MAVDMFLKLDAIKGESADSKHKDWIEVLDFSRSPLKWQNAVKYGWKI